MFRWDATIAFARLSNHCRLGILMEFEIRKREKEGGTTGR